MGALGFSRRTAAGEHIDERRAARLDFLAEKASVSGTISHKVLISASGAVDASTPESPNRIASHCAALTTTRITTSAPDAASREELIGPPNSLAKRSAAAGLASAPATGQPFSRQVGGDAISDGAKSDHGDLVRFHAFGH